MGLLWLERRDPSGTVGQFAAAVREIREGD
jgi:hypothetical protein